MNLTIDSTNIHDEDDMNRFMFFLKSGVFLRNALQYLIIYLILLMTSSSVISLQLSATHPQDWGLRGVGR